LMTGLQAVDSSSTELLLPLLQRCAPKSRFFMMAKVGKR